MFVTELLQEKHVTDTSWILVSNKNILTRVWDQNCDFLFPDDWLFYVYHDN